MKQTINESAFIRAFRDFGRDENFSVTGLRALFEYLEQYEQDVGEELELDVIALCCDFHEISVDEIERVTGCADLDELRDKTIVIEVDDETIIYQSF
jgi:hypothetical protein